MVCNAACIPASQHKALLEDCISTLALALGSFCGWSGRVCGSVGQSPFGGSSICIRTADIRLSRSLLLERARDLLHRSRHLLPHTSHLGHCCCCKRTRRLFERRVCARLLERDPARSCLRWLAARRALVSSKLVVDAQRT